jgi:hypothetical protein
MGGECINRSIVDLFELLGFPSSFFAYRPDSCVTLSCDSVADRRFVCLDLQLELLYAILGCRSSQLDEPLGLLSRLSEHRLELDFGL